MTLPPLKCGGCTTCCHGDTIPLVEGHNPTLYKTKVVNGQRVLAKKNGECIYLGKSGCKIYDRQPIVCRTMDCRKFALWLRDMPAPAREGRLQDLKHARINAEGERRLKELPEVA